MVSYYKIILGAVNLIAGCIAGSVLVELTGNNWYYIINGITGWVGGALVAYAFLGEQE